MPYDVYIQIGHASFQRLTKPLAALCQMARYYLPGGRDEALRRLWKCWAGERTFKQPIRKADDLVAQVRRRASCFDRHHAGRFAVVGRERRSPSVSNIRPATLSRRLATKSRLTHDESDRTLRMARVVDWPNEILGGRRQSLATMGGRRIRAWADGGPSISSIRSWGALGRGNK